MLNPVVTVVVNSLIECEDYSFKSQSRILVTLACEYEASCFSKNYVKQVFCIMPGLQSLQKPYYCSRGTIYESNILCTSCQIKI